MITFLPLCGGECWIRRRAGIDRNRHRRQIAPLHLPRNRYLTGFCLKRSRVNQLCLQISTFFGMSAATVPTAAMLNKLRRNDPVFTTTRMFCIPDKCRR